MRNALKSLFYRGIDFLRRIRIQYRLLIIFLFVSLVPAVCIGAYAYRVYTASINDKLTQSSAQAMYLLNNNLMTQLEKFRDYCNVISVTQELQLALSQEPSSDFHLDRSTVTALNDLLRTTPIQSKYMKNIRIVDRRGNIVYDLGYDDVPKERFHELLAGIEAASPQDSLQYIRTYRSYDKIVLGRKIFSMYNFTEHVGYILIYIDEKLLSEDIFSNVSFGPGSNIMFLDAAGNVISSKNRELLGSRYDSGEMMDSILENRAQERSSFSMKLNGEPSIVIYNYNSVYDTYLVATIPVTYITRETSSINRMLAVLAILLILASLTATMVVYISIILPIRHMVVACGNMDENLEAHIADESRDELGFLAGAIDQMMARIRQLLNQWQLDQKRKRELELEMLHYQINPHFLFNTLNTLKWIAVMNDVPVLNEGISSLSSLLQSTLLGKKEFIPLGEEIDNLKHYISIQKIRYANSFDVCYEIDDTLLTWKVPRFLLQPLAENSILHGTSENAPSICITLKCLLSPEKELLLFLSDTGKGVELSRIYDSGKERFTGIGLNNVDERLRLHYGPAYGLTIRSTPGCGTLCLIHIPQSRNEKEEI